MILYNMRNRGPYEYDKFTLNVLQIHNAVTLSEMQELKNANKNKDSLVQMQKEVNDVYETLVGSKDKIGLSEKQYLKTFLIKEEY